MVHYEDTIRKKVAFDRIHRHIESSLRRRLEGIFQGKRIAVWGSRDSGQNRSKFDRMKEGDEVLIVEGQMIRLLGRIAGKTVSASLSRKLWKNLKQGSSEPWELVYFIANPREIELPFSEFSSLFGYEENYQLRGFTSVAEKRLENFYNEFDDLYSVLSRLRDKQPIERLADPDVVKEAAGQYQKEQNNVDDSDPGDSENKTSEHLRMQYLLLRLGRQAGEKVWAPKGDQGRLKSQFNFEDFEETFAAGLDTQVKYVDNIDVVWKDEFRIDAAFEIENSTSIYSGLLRFADLGMVAPNTLYPLFLVAPSERRNRVKEQLSRPIFKHLHLAEKVRYLTYERVNEIDQFFGDEGRGVSVNVFVDKSEKMKV